MKFYVKNTVLVMVLSLSGLAFVTLYLSSGTEINRGLLEDGAFFTNLHECKDLTSEQTRKIDSQTVEFFKIQYSAAIAEIAKNGEEKHEWFYYKFVFVGAMLGLFITKLSADLSSGEESQNPQQIYNLEPPEGDDSLSNAFSSISKSPLFVAL